MYVGIRQAARQLSRLVNQAVYGHEHITITSRGKPKAVLLSIQEYTRLTQTRPRSEALQRARRLRETFAARYGVLSVDLVQAARQEREAHMTAVLASPGANDEPGR